MSPDTLDYHSPTTPLPTTCLRYARLLIVTGILSILCAPYVFIPFTMATSSLLGVAPFVPNGFILLTLLTCALIAVFVAAERMTHPRQSALSPVVTLLFAASSPVLWILLANAFSGFSPG